MIEVQGTDKRNFATAEEIDSMLLRQMRSYSDSDLDAAIESISGKLAKKREFLRVANNLMESNVRRSEKGLAVKLSFQMGQKADIAARTEEVKVLDQCLQALHMEREFRSGSRLSVMR